MDSIALLLRRLCALLLLIASIAIWMRHSDVIELIARQRPVLFGRYSQGHFGVLLILTPVLWALAAASRQLQQIVKLSREHGALPIFIYAPSAPHVILPLVEQAIPAQQLRNFAAYKSEHLPAAEAFKQQVFSNLDSEQQVVMDFCQQQVDCLALTDALRNASASGQQTYFTYDQHWTPLGHVVAASAIEIFLREKNLL